MIKVQTAAFRARLAKLQVDLESTAMVVLNRTVDYALETAQGTKLFENRSGKTRASIKKGLRGRMGWVKATGKLARMLEGGTRAHMIYPKKAADFVGPVRRGQGRRSRGRARSVLAFQMNGSWRFARSVKHPGTAARPFMAFAQKMATEIIFTRHMGQQTTAAIARFNG